MLSCDSYQIKRIMFNSQQNVLYSEFRSKKIRNSHLSGPIIEYRLELIFIIENIFRSLMQSFNFSLHYTIFKENFGNNCMYSRISLTFQELTCLEKMKLQVKAYIFKIEKAISSRIYAKLLAVSCISLMCNGTPMYKIYKYVGLGGDSKSSS